MRIANLFRLSSLAAALAPITAPAAPATTPTDPPTASIAGWDEFIEGLRMLPEKLLANLPADRRTDPQVQQEISRLVLKSLAASLIESLGTEGDHPAFVANQNVALNYPQPNADTTYRVSRVTPGGTYRLRGQRGSLRQAILGQSGPLPGEPGAGSLKAAPKREVLDISSLKVDGFGRYDLIVSPERPPGYTGNWWQLQANTTRLLLRAVRADLAAEQDPTISIERIDIPPGRPRTPASVLEAQLRDLPRAAAFLPSIFVSTGARLRSEGFLHRFKLVDAAQNGGLSGQVYYSSAYELNDDDALLITVRPPDKCRYRSIQLASEYQETIDWYNNQTSLNDIQARPDADGLLRIVVSARDPGVTNWLDTAGHPRGIIEGRWMDCESSPAPTIEKLPLRELNARLRADMQRISPQQRQAMIRDRRSSLQQRPLW